VTGYHLEQRLVSRPSSWLRVGALVTGTSLRATGLIDGQTYQFRVAAENRVGVGEASPTTGPVLARDPWEKPGRPGLPQVSEVTRRSCRLSWFEPTSDGGDDIRGYIVEYKVECQLNTCLSCLVMFYFSLLWVLHQASNVYNIGFKYFVNSILTVTVCEAFLSL
jgi:hypothetical protein